MALALHIAAIYGRSDSKRIILIGGAPTVGKSTLAALLSRRLEIPWISSDHIRQIIRSVVRPEDAPQLFTTKGYTAERFLNEFSAEEIVRMEIEDGEAVWVGVRDLVRNDYTWRNGFIVEGVGILPHLVKADFEHNHNVKPVFLIDDDVERTRNVVFTRGLWGAPTAIKLSPKVQKMCFRVYRWW